jgi:hypothetical protein
MKQTLALIAVLLVEPVYAGEIADVFGDGVFSTRWGYGFQEVQEQFPSARGMGSEPNAYLQVKDGRTVFSVKRKNNSLLTFGFDSLGRLSSVAVEFDGNDFPELLNRLDTSFGPHTNEENDLGAVIVKWPEDNGVKLSMVGMPGTWKMDLTLGIEYLGLDKPEVSKESLGLD